MRLRNKVGAVLAAAVAVVGFQQAPASAASGGGCRNGAGGYIGSCISFNLDYGGSVYSDFYINWNAGCRKMVMIPYTNGSPRSSTTYTVGYGRYGPVRTNVAKLPQQSQSAFTRVNHYDCNWNYLGQVDSPTVYFVA